MLMKIIFILLFGTIYCVQWDVSILGELANGLAEKHCISCFVIVHTGDKASVYTVSKLMKTLQGIKNLRSIGIVRFNETNNLCGCQTNLYLFMAWTAGARFLYPMFEENLVEGNPLWLLPLPDGQTSSTFFADTFLPFQAHVLTAFFTEKGVHLEEVWQVSKGYEIHIQPFGTWTTTGWHCDRKDCQFAMKENLEGYPFRAATKEDMPISGPSIIDGKHAIEGFFGIIYHNLVEQFNCTAVVSPPMSATGTKQDGHWNGLIGLLERNESDAAVGPLSIQNVQVSNFLKPLLRTNYQVFFKQDGTVLEWGAFLKPFESLVWHLLIVWFILGSLGLNFIYTEGIKHDQEVEIFQWEYSRLNAFFTFLRALCQQGHHIMPKSLSCRALYLTGYLTSLILFTAYSAALITKLTLQEPVRPFDSLETFLRDGSYKLIAIKESTDYDYFSASNHSTLAAIYERQMKMIRESELPTTKEEALQMICNEKKKAFFVTFTVTILAAQKLEAFNRNCRILYFQRPLGTVSLSIGIRKHFPFEEVFNYRLQIMVERGIVNRLRRREWGLTALKNSKVTTVQVEIQQVTQIHGVLVIGFILSLLILYIEKMTSSSRKFEWKLPGSHFVFLVSAIFSIIAFILLITIVIHLA